MSAEQKPSRVFGPVPSRRLGLSLGVDLVPYKTCSYDCVYCQIGRTSECTAERRDFGGVEEALEEAAARLAAGPRPDYVTLSGSGEPTLHSRLGDAVSGLKALGVPVAVLTNGSLLWRDDVARDLAGSDLVCPSLDAATPEAWRKVNRPAAGLGLSRVLEGLVSFRAGFPAQIWLEVLLVAGVNDSEDDVRRLAETAARGAPDRIQLNTAVRPPADAGVMPVSPEALERFAEFFTPRAEVIASFSGRGTPGGPHTGAAGDRAAEVLEMLARRPCTLEDVCAGLGMNAAEASKLLGELAFFNDTATTETDGRTYYEVAAR
ncbi:MAG: radical SAM protein [Planctomycetota bacterium]|jgi:wyosine [tRNA(Phe)-imidazoG37] synthetase (radical SAM superfamily)